MGNYFHVLLETPEPNLVAGMKWGSGIGGGADPEKDRDAYRWVAARLGMGQEVGDTGAALIPG